MPHRTKLRYGLQSPPQRTGYPPRKSRCFSAAGCGYSLAKEAAGADGIIIPKRRSAALTPTVYKTSAGAASWIPVARVPNLVSSMEYLKSQNIWIYGTDASGADYTTTDLRGGIAFVIGSEGYGMGKLVKEKCDFLVSLPMAGHVNSLNASVAAGIFMYEAVRQRNK